MVCFLALNGVGVRYGRMGLVDFSIYILTAIPSIPPSLPLPILHPLPPSLSTLTPSPPSIPFLSSPPHSSSSPSLPPFLPLLHPLPLSPPSPALPILHPLPHSTPPSIPSIPTSLPFLQPYSKPTHSHYVFSSIFLHKRNIYLIIRRCCANVPDQLYSYFCTFDEINRSMTLSFSLSHMHQPLLNFLPLFYFLFSFFSFLFSLFFFLFLSSF